jgi:DNA-binding transcriptional LysR family regulator
MGHSPGNRINQGIMEIIIPMMERYMDYLNDMALFVEVAKARGFRRAAEARRRADLDPLAAHRAARTQSVGLRLFTRTTRRIELTEAGQLYFERSKRIIDEARIAHEELATMLAQPTGLLRDLRAAGLRLDLAGHRPEGLSSQRYPGITFDLDLTPRNVDLIAEPFDLAIRMANPGPSHLVSRVIGRLTPEAIRRARPTSPRRASRPIPAQLEQHQCLTMKTVPELGAALPARWHRLTARVSKPLQGQQCIAILRQLAVQGLGIVNLPERASLRPGPGGRHRSDERPAGTGKGSPMSIHAVTETKLLPAKTQRFIEFLKERFQT